MSKVKQIIVVKNMKTASVTNEVVRFSVGIEDIDNIVTIPISLRMSHIEAVFRKYAQKDNQIIPEDDLKILSTGLVYSAEYIKQMLRTYVAFESNYVELFIEPKYSIKEDDNPPMWRWLNIVENQLEDFEELYLGHMTDKDRNFVVNLMGKIYNNLFKRDILLQDKVYLFNILKYNIEIISLGDINSYRYRELTKEILTAPNNSHLITNDSETKCSCSVDIMCL